MHAKCTNQLFVYPKWSRWKCNCLLFISLQYAVLLFLLLVAQIVVGVLIFTNKREFQQLYTRALHRLWNKRTEPRVMEFWDGLQSTVRFDIFYKQFSPTYRN